MKSWRPAGRARPPSWPERPPANGTARRRDTGAGHHVGEEAIAVPFDTRITARRRRRNVRRGGSARREEEVVRAFHDPLRGQLEAVSKRDLSSRMNARIRAARAVHAAGERHLLGAVSISLWTVRPRLALPSLAFRPDVRHVETDQPRRRGAMEGRRRGPASCLVAREADRHRDLPADVPEASPETTGTRSVKNEATTRAAGEERAFRPAVGSPLHPAPSSIPAGALRHHAITSGGGWAIPRGSGSVREARRERRSREVRGWRGAAPADRPRRARRRTSRAWNASVSGSRGRHRAPRAKAGLRPRASDLRHAGRRRHIPDRSSVGAKSAEVARR